MAIETEEVLRDHLSIMSQSCAFMPDLILGSNIERHPWQLNLTIRAVPSRFSEGHDFKRGPTISAFFHQVSSRKT